MAVKEFALPCRPGKVFIFSGSFYVKRYCAGGIPRLQLFGEGPSL
jgi:hypothetical protein